MNKKYNSKGTNTAFKDALKKLSEKYSKSDKTNLVSLMTGCLFLLFALVQVALVIFTPLARTFDHVSLILVDLIIAAFCFVFVLYRRGMLASFTNDGVTRTFHNSRQNDRRNQPASADAARVCIPEGRAKGAPSKKSSAPSVNSRSSRVCDDEKLFSPRHRYSGSRPENSRTEGTRKTR